MDRPTKYRLAFIGLCILGSMFGCATARPAAPEPETVGALAPSYNSIATAPVHASTNLAPGFQAVDTDDASPVVASDGGPVGEPEVNAKAAHGF